MSHALSLDGGSHLPRNSCFIGLQDPVCSTTFFLMLVLYVLTSHLQETPFVL